MLQPLRAAPRVRRLFRLPCRGLPATEIAVNSFGISGRVVFAGRGRERRAGWVEVDTFYFSRGKWRPTGKIAAVGGFGSKAEEVGRYKFVVRHEGARAATLIVDVRSLRGRWNEFTVPLKADGCAREARTRRGKMRKDGPSHRRA